MRIMVVTILDICLSVHLFLWVRCGVVIVQQYVCWKKRKKQKTKTETVCCLQIKGCTPLWKWLKTIVCLLCDINLKTITSCFFFWTHYKKWKWFRFCIQNYTISKSDSIIYMIWHCVTAGTWTCFVVGQIYIY